MDKSENEQRFELAKAALTGLLASPHLVAPFGMTLDESARKVAESSVKFADATLDALNAPRQNGTPKRTETGNPDATTENT